MHTLKGQLLIAAPSLVDPNFARTIVLMIEHDDKGALGLVLNRPTDTSLKQAWEHVSNGPCDRDELLYHGGPCEGPLMVVHSSPGVGNNEVLDGVFFSAESHQIEQLVEWDDHQPTRFFVGYAGWSAGQLEGELATGSWLTAPASQDVIFGCDDDELWDLVVKSVSRCRAHPRLKPHMVPRDPSMN